MTIDCGTCTARPAACADCVVTFLTIGVCEDDASTPATGRDVDLDAAEQRAIDVLAGSGLVPPLRLEHRKAG